MSSSATVAGRPRPPLFVVFGMPRSGTTYLFHELRKHPEIFVPHRKETHYFSVNHWRGESWFLPLWSDLQPGQIGADINPMYYLDDEALDRVLAYDPSMKVVLGVREPTDFAISLYGNMLAHGMKVPDVVQVSKEFAWPVTPERSLRYSLAGGFHQRRIGELRRRLGANLLLYDFADFDRSPLPTLQAIERFLGLRPYFDASTHENLRINASGRRNPLLLNHLLRSQRVLDAIYAVLPPGAVRRARGVYERMSVRGRPTAGREPSAPVSAAQRAELSRLFVTDAAHYREMFADRPIIGA